MPDIVAERTLDGLRAHRATERKLAERLLHAGRKGLLHVGREERPSLYGPATASRLTRTRPSTGGSQGLIRQLRVAIDAESARVRKFMALGLTFLEMDPKTARLLRR